MEARPPTSESAHPEVEASPHESERARYFFLQGDAVADDILRSEQGLLERLSAATGLRKAAQAFMLITALMRPGNNERLFAGVASTDEVRELEQVSLVESGVSEYSNPYSRLRDYFEHDDVVRVLSADATVKEGSLYFFRDELVDSLPADKLRDLVLATVTKDPLTAIELLGSIQERASSTDFDAVVDRAVAQRAFRELEKLDPGILLGQAKRLRELAGQFDQRGLVDGLIFSVLARAQREPAGYRYIIEHYSTYSQDVSSLHEHFTALYGDAAMQAYQSYDLTSFVDLFHMLSERQRGVLEAEYERSVQILYGDVRPEARMRYGDSLDLSTPFRAGDTAYFTKDLPIYIARLTQDKLDNTAHYEIYRGRAYTKVQGNTLLNMPKDTFDAILSSSAFHSVLEHSNVERSYANVLSYVHAIYNTLNDHDVPMSEESVRAVAGAIDRIYEKAQHVELLGPNVKLIVAAHEEDAFSARDIVERLYEPAGGLSENVIFSGKGVSIDPERGDRNTVKQGFLDAVRHASDGPTTIVLTGHGSPLVWGFSENTTDSLNLSLSKSEKGLTYQELGDALMESGNVGNMRIILAACFSYDYLQNLAEYLKERGSNDLPLIAISESDQGRYAYYSKDTSRFLASHLLAGLVENKIGDAERSSIHLKDVLKTESKAYPGISVTIFKAINVGPDGDNPKERERMFLELGSVAHPEAGQAETLSA